MRLAPVSALFFGATLGLAPVAVAAPDAAHPWDASWAGGWENGGDGIQVIVAGDSVVGFFYGPDYVAVTETSPLAADGSLAFRFEGGTGTLSGSGEERTVTVDRAGQPPLAIKIHVDQ